MKAPTSDIMGSMTRSILTLGSYDKEKESLEIPNVLRQSMQLIAVFPMLAVYAYPVSYTHLITVALLMQLAQKQAYQSSQAKKVFSTKQTQ